MARAKSVAERFLIIFCFTWKVFQYVQNFTLTACDQQSQIHVGNEPVHDAGAPTATNVSMRQKQVTIFEDVIDSCQHSARVESHVSSSDSTKEANREQHLSNHYRGDAVTSAGATTPDNDTAEAPR